MAERKPPGGPTEVDSVASDLFLDAPNDPDWMRPPLTPAEGPTVRIDMAPIPISDTLVNAGRPTIVDDQPWLPSARSLAGMDEEDTSVLATDNEAWQPPNPWSQTPTQPRPGAPLPVGVPLAPAAPVKPLEPKLPCGVLLVDTDLKVASALAGRLMERGYTCRVASPTQAPSVLSSQSFDAVLVGAASENEVNSAVAAMAFKGPLVFSVSSSVTGLTRAALPRPCFADDAVVALEQARQTARPALALAKPNPEPRKPASKTESGPSELAGPTRIPIERSTSGRSLPWASGSLVALDVNVVRVLLIGGEASARGRARGMSNQGDLVLDIRSPPPIGTSVNVELILADGRRSDFVGKVHRALGSDCALKLELDAQAPAFLDAYLREAMDITQPAPEQIRIRVGPMTMIPGEEELEILWRDCKEQLADNDAQQKFIQACLRAQKVEFAVRCYRDLKQARPGDPLPAKYLAQVGTILGFFALQKAPEVADTGMSRSMKFTLLGFVLAVVFLTGLAMFLAFDR